MTGNEAFFAAPILGDIVRTPDGVVGIVIRMVEANPWTEESLYRVVVRDGEGNISTWYDNVIQTVLARPELKSVTWYSGTSTAHRKTPVPMWVLLWTVPAREPGENPPRFLTQLHGSSQKKHCGTTIVTWS